MIRTLMMGAVGVYLSGCSFYARGADDYRKVTRDLVKTRSEQLQACYEDELHKDETAGGKVAVDFRVEAKTGRLLSPEIVASETTASEPLQRCVVTALDGLLLAPPDQRTAKAHFVWDFEQT